MIFLKCLPFTSVSRVKMSHCTISIHDILTSKNYTKQITKSLSILKGTKTMFEVMRLHRTFW